MKLTKVAAATALAAMLGFGPSAHAVPVSLELALLVDVSGSVDAGEYNLQKTGYINAFQNSAIHTAIASLTNGIAVTYIEWAGANTQAQLVGWTHITDAASSNAFATAINGTSRSCNNTSGFVCYTQPGNAISFATPLFMDNGFEGERWVIDVSGDGEQFGTNSVAEVPIDTATARNAFLGTASGAEGLTKAINGLAIGGISLFNWYTANIQGGTNSFVIQAASFADFDNAVTTKIGREIAPPPTLVPEPASLALLGIGLMGLAASRRRKQAA